MNSMTGFAHKEIKIPSLGKVSVEIRSTNHKFLEIAFHLPSGFAFLEDKIRNEIESRIKRGRLICAVNIFGFTANDVFINKALLKKYICAINGIKSEFKIENRINIDTIVHLPGILSVEENKVPFKQIWPRVKKLVNAALYDLVNTRKKEGQALAGFLKNRANALTLAAQEIKSRFKIAVQKKLKAIATAEERAAFLKDSDISEEIERLSFHINNFKAKMLSSYPVGKELDFIAQEMQREANTLGAKTFDVLISAKVVQVKSQIEKIREQVQNIE